MGRIGESKLVRWAVYGGIISWVFLLLQYLDVFAPHVFTHTPGECGFVKGIVNGSDDFALSRFGVFASGGPSTSKVYLIQGRKATACKIRGAPFRFVPLGISILETDSHSRLFVVNGWRDGWSRSSSVEIFDIENEGRTLQHIRSVQSGLFNFVNDVHAVSEDSFWFSNSFGTSFPGYFLEFIARYSGGAVGYYDGKVVTLAAKHIAFANGIAMHGNFLYVASTGKKSIVTYKVGDRQIDRLGELPMHCGIDNLNTDRETGDLWVACNPVMYEALSTKYIGGMLSSKVFRVKVGALGVPLPGSITEIYSNSGTRFGHSDGATSTLRDGTDLWIGSPQGRVLHCNMTKYIGGP